MCKLWILLFLWLKAGLRASNELLRRQTLEYLEEAQGIRDQIQRSAQQQLQAGATGSAANSGAAGSVGDESDRRGQLEAIIARLVRGRLRLLKIFSIKMDSCSDTSIL